MAKKGAMNQQRDAGEGRISTGKRFPEACYNTDRSVCSVDRLPTIPNREGGSALNVLRINSSPRYKRDNITSYLLVSEDTCNSKSLTISIVDMEPGGIQHLHSHEPEQMYYIMEGSGLMTVDDEQQQVKAGDCIFFSSLLRHGLENTGGGVLRYLSAASPSFTREDTRKLWPLKSVDEGGK